MNSVGVDYEKLTQLLNFFIKKNDNSRIQKVKAIKLVWAADRYHARKYGRLVSADAYCAMEFGPVASATKDVANIDQRYVDEVFIDYINSIISRDEKGYVLYSHGAVDEKQFSKTDVEAMEFAWNTFGNLDGFAIANISHEYPEWKKFKNQIESGLTKSEPIDVADFFEDPDVLTLIANDPFALSGELIVSSKAALLGRTSNRTAVC